MSNIVRPQFQPPKPMRPPFPVRAVNAVSKSEDQPSLSTPLDVEPVAADFPVNNEDLPEVSETDKFTLPPIYFGAVRLLDFADTARGGMSIQVAILDAPPTGLHPFKGLYCGKQSGQRLKAWFGNLGEEVGAGAAIYAGEGLLMRWSDDSVNGMSLKLLLDCGPDGTNGIHPFRGLAHGRQEGEKLQMAAWAVSDDEKLIDPRRTRKRVPFYELSEVKQAHILCGDDRFVSYLKKHEERLARKAVIEVDVLVHPREYAAKLLYAYLGIDSRGKLSAENAEGQTAQKRWAALLKEYYDDYYNRR